MSYAININKVQVIKNRWQRNRHKLAYSQKEENHPCSNEGRLEPPFQEKPNPKCLCLFGNHNIFFSFDLTMEIATHSPESKQLDCVLISSHRIEVNFNVNILKWLSICVTGHCFGILHPVFRFNAVGLVQHLTRRFLCGQHWSYFGWEK